jgi:hypothetical protein
MPKIPGLSLSSGTLRRLFFISRYRFCTIAQFAKIANYSNYHAGEILRKLESRSAVGFFGFTNIPGQGRTPKVYFLRRRGWEYLLTEGEYSIEEVGAFVEVSQDLTWTPQMYHRLAILDLFVALEREVFAFSHLSLVKTLVEYRRVKGTYIRETADYIADVFVPENRIVPDGAFILENRLTGRRGLFFVEADMGTERISAPASMDQRATIMGKLSHYDRYLTSGRFALKFRDHGEFRSCTLLFVTTSAERIENIRKEARRLPPRLHPYYRLAIFQEALTNFLGSIWKSRDAGDTVAHALVQTEE